MQIAVYKNNIAHAFKRLRQNPVGGSHLVRTNRESIMEMISFDSRERAV